MKKVSLYKVKSFGDKLSSVFDFISENKKIYLQSLLNVFLPIAVLLALCGVAMVASMGGQLLTITEHPEAFAALSATSILSIVMMYILGLVAICMLSSINFTLVREYDSRPNGFEGVPFSELQGPIWHGCWRAFLAFLFTGLVCTIAIIVLAIIFSIFGATFGWRDNVWIMLFLIFLTILACMVFVLPLSLFLPDYIISGDSITTSFGRSYRYGLRTWWGVLGQMIVMGIIAYIVMLLFMIPFYILFGIDIAMDNSGELTSGVQIGLAVGMFIALLLAAVGEYFAYSMTNLALAFQWGHAAEKLDGKSTEDEVENFENL